MSLHSHALFYLLLDPPWWVVVLWVVAGSCLVCTLVISSGHIRQHMEVAEHHGFGGNPFVAHSSYGPRADRVLLLILMPPIFSVTALAQMLFPRLESICSLLRTVQVAFAVVRLAELMYLLAGGWVRVQEHLPREPFPVFGQPPLCLFFGWRCCARRITDRDIYFMALGMRQFAVVAPVAGTVDTCAHIARLYSARAPASEWSVAFVFLQVLTALYSATTLIGMWSFNNLYHVLSRAVPETTKRLRERQLFVVMQMVSSKLVEMLLTLFFLSDTFLKWSIELPETRIGPPDQLATLVSGCYLCVVELLLAVLGLRAFDVSEQVYPTPDLTAGYPLDMVAQLQLCGVRQGAYALLSRLEAQAQAPLPPLRESSGEDSDDASESASETSGLSRRQLLQEARAAAPAPSDGSSGTSSGFSCPSPRGGSRAWALAGGQAVAATLRRPRGQNN